MPTKNNLVISADLLKGALKIGFRTFVITLEIFQEGVDDTPGRIFQALASRIVADPADELAHSLQRAASR